MKPENELTESLEKVMNHGTTRYRGVIITKMYGKYHFLRYQAGTIEEAKEMIDQMWKDINSKSENKIICKSK